MSWQPFCLVKSVLTVAFGAIFLIIPTLLWSLFGFSESAHAVLLSRMIGILYVALGVMVYNMRNMESSPSRKQTAVTIGVADLFTASLFALAIVQSVVNPLGWLLFASYGIFGVIWFTLK